MEVLDVLLGETFPFPCLTEWSPVQLHSSSWHDTLRGLQVSDLRDGWVQDSIEMWRDSLIERHVPLTASADPVQALVKDWVSSVCTLKTDITQDFRDAFLLIEQSVFGVRFYGFDFEFDDRIIVFALEIAGEVCYLSAQEPFVEPTAIGYYIDSSDDEEHGSIEQHYNMGVCETPKRKTREHKESTTPLPSRQT